MTEIKEINIKDNSNTINIINDDKDKNEKFSYKKDLWMYFDKIKDKFFFDRTKAKALLYIISQKNDIEYEYSESLKYLYNQFVIQFDHPTNQTYSNNINNDNSLNITINHLINSLKNESELFANHSQDILENVIKPLEGFIMNQCELCHELIDLMENYEKEFKFVNQQMEQKQINFHHGAKSVETAINKLELVKNRINNKNKKEELDDSFNNDKHIFSLEDEDSENEMIEKLNEMVQKNSSMAIQLQKEYQDYIIKANNEREKYIKLSEHIYDKVQNLDEEFIKMMKNQIKLIIDKDINLIENIKKEKIILLDYTNKINHEHDINIFINSKINKFSLPKQFEYVDYNPDVILRNRKGFSESSQHEISLKILENLKQIFKYKKPSTSEIEEENLNFVNDSVNDIWDGNNYNKKKLDVLFKEHIYRLHFLRTLNQYRVEGIFILKNISFQNFCMTLSSLLDSAIIDKDFESIKLCMILSQTFYLEGEKKILLQSGITLNTIWQKKDFWIKMIEYSINEEINYGKGFLIFLEEDSKSREKRVESAIMSTLITFLFNMKLFGYPEDDIKIVIDEFIEKYKIDGAMIYATNVNMKEIKDDIIVESVENIIKNDLKEDINNNNSNRKNTNDSKNEEKNNIIRNNTNNTNDSKSEEKSNNNSNLNNNDKDNKSTSENSNNKNDNA